jgi:type I restriction-modification system DNA methylase subunit
MAIPQTFDGAFERAKELVSIFSENEGKYLSPGYSEAQARLDFIDKFWIALGWDVNHESQTDPYKQEVKVERGVATNEFRKRADYAFLAPNFRDVRFYVEAKKPHGGIDDPNNYFQTIRYGWNSHTPLAVLTDFEEFRVLDCRYKPHISTALGNAKLKYHCTDYVDKEKFRTIYYLFSREAVLAGSIEEFAKGLPKLSRKRAQRGVSADAHQSIDESFLQELDDFREELARAYKRKNPELDSAELTEVTQRTLDRLVFMSFLEDKLIEAEPLIEDLHQPGKSWKNFIATSRRLDRIYNGIIFKEHSLLDSDSFKADENVFNKITQSLSHTGSPYDFNAIPIHILGSIYERFLGKVIVATDKRASVQEKPEVRKAGGVYYTPEYIVRYIVDNTVGKLVAGKTPAEIQEMRFADIACGSGSFLLGVYDTLLRYHTGYYNRTKQNRKEGIKAGCIQRPDGALQLSLLLKRQILLNNIYGVDIDLQAVEVAQLSLYLKLLEDETIASAHQQLAMREALLPSLSKNIVCGNSLIGWDITEGKLFDTADERGLNPMNFEDAFPEVMKRGGFDAIVGNPPYVRQEMLGNIKPYLQKHYKTYHGVADLYVYFFERDASLLKPDGVFGIIVASKWMRTKYGEGLRRWLKQYRIEEIIDFGDLPVFQGATTYTCIVRLKNSSSQEFFPATQAETLDSSKQNLTDYVSEHRYEVNQASLGDGGWSLANESAQGLIKQLFNIGLPLHKYVNNKIYYGIKTGFNEAFVIDASTRQRLIDEDARSAEIIKPFLVGRDIKRYQQPQSEKFVIFTRRGVNIDDYPAIRSYLQTFKRKLTPKPINWKGEKWDGRKPGAYQWYEIQDTVDYYMEFEKPKILWAGISAEVAAFALDKLNYYGNDNNQLIVVDDNYLLGILNSSVTRFLLTNICDKVQGGFYRLKIIYIEQLPIRTINFSDKADRTRYDRMVQLVDQMLEAKKQLAAARSEGDKNFYESKCATLDRQIDTLVYELYDLTPEEIAIVEGRA